jgi:hypothetical protein
MVSLEFFIDIILPATLWPWDQLTQLLIEMSAGIIFWGGKGGWCTIALNCGSLNLLELTGPVQTCIGIALPFTSGMLFFVVMLLFAISRSQSKTA